MSNARPTTRDRPLRDQVAVVAGATRGAGRGIALAKSSVVRLGYAMASDLHAHRVTALTVTPGFLRSEAMLDELGVTEERWRDAVAKDPYFAESETPCYVGRAVAALAADPGVSSKSGGDPPRSGTRPRVDSAP